MEPISSGQPLIVWYCITMFTPKLQNIVHSCILLLSTGILYSSYLLHNVDFYSIALGNCLHNTALCSIMDLTVSLHLVDSIVQHCLIQYVFRHPKCSFVYTSIHFGHTISPLKMSGFYKTVFVTINKIIIIFFYCKLNLIQIIRVTNKAT